MRESELGSTSLSHHSYTGMPALEELTPTPAKKGTEKRELDGETPEHFSSLLSQLRVFFLKKSLPRRKVRFNPCLTNTFILSSEFLFGPLFCAVGNNKP